MKLRILLSVVAVALTAVPAAVAAHGVPTVPPQPIADSQMHLTTTVIGNGVPDFLTTRTIPHWFGSTLNPVDGITYGYNIVGANPFTCVGAACDTTIQVDIIPVNVNLDGMSFNGSDVVPALLGSPLFALNDYGSTPYATAGDSFDRAPRGPGGVLSQGDAGNLLQLQDAIMRAQFNAVGMSAYHVRLHPTVLPAQTLDIPQSQGLLLQSGRGVPFAAVDLAWFVPKIGNLVRASDPTHLALLVSDDTLIYGGSTKAFGCCILGFHSVNELGFRSSTVGNAPIQTMAWGTWMSPGLDARPNGGAFWAMQDMTVFSHEIAEWADDPYANNAVPPWPFDPRNLQLGCNPILETGDPVGSAGFAMGLNTFRQGPNPNGTQSADGYYHPEDEATLPWFMGLEPNLMSEPMQTPSPHVGRYTFMGDLNTFFAFQHPAARC